MRTLVCLGVVSFVYLFSSCNDKKPLFREHSPDDTGVTFNNALILSDSLTVLEFEYMYNGAGVAVADFDRDGLQDLFFTANMSSNRLYRNLGDWKFKDITAQTHTGATRWSNGVAIVDINQDGYPDIYVSCGGSRSSVAKDRDNLLYINNGKKGDELRFTESAEAWGLNDDSYSVQAAFFDYDGDGDLDVYLLSNALVDFNRNTRRPKDRSGNAPSVDKLFRNNGDETFTDVSEEAGIQIEGFGLGVEICDINRDGWPDIYVSNDFLTDDILYVNQQDGTFQNQIRDYFQHLTYNGMGNDIADINNDGFMDVVVLDMLPEDNKRWKLTMMGNNYSEFQTGLSYGYMPQYIRNTLQLNNGNGTFSEIGQMAGIAATEWSWSALFADFDQDGLNDLCVTNGYRQDITNLDFMVYGNRVLTMGTAEANRKQRLDELNKLPGIKLPNYFYHNSGDLTFENRSKEAGFTTPTYSNGMAYADLDNDGDLDLVINNIDDPAGIYENQGEAETKGHYIKFNFKGRKPNLNGLGSSVELRYSGQKQKEYHTPYRGYLSTVEHGLHFGLGPVQQIDTVLVTWPDGKKQLLTQVAADQAIDLKYENATTWEEKPQPVARPLFEPLDSVGLEHAHREDDFVDFKMQPLLPYMHSRNGPGLAVGDINGDGLDDCFAGGAAGQAGALLIQQPDGTFLPKDFEDPDYEDMGCLFFDADGDGDQDLYVVSGGSSFPEGDPLYQDRLYENDGGGKFKRSAGLPKFTQSGAAVAAADYDKDGKIDLFVGGRVRPGSFPLKPKSFLLKNTSQPGQLQFEKDVQQGLPVDLGMVTAAIWTDFDNDSWPDLMVTGEFMPIRFFKNNHGILKEIEAGQGLRNTRGWWNSIVAGDFDEDGDMDYVLGNLGLNSRYQASEKEPLSVYAKDYDKNGTVDPIMCQYINGENYIVHSRSDLIAQISAMRGRFRSYSDYAEATFKQSFLKEELADAYVVQSETFASSYLENLGNGKFRITPLPLEAQTAPIYGMITGDFNQDGHLDLLAVGNFYSGEVFSGQYDASFGWFLAGDGKGGLHPVEARESGFLVKGDAKSLVELTAGGRQVFIAGINNGPLEVQALNASVPGKYQVQEHDTGALIRYADDSTQRFEFNRGSGYLSQSGRTLRIPETAISVKIYNDQGEEHEILVAQ